MPRYTADQYDEMAKHCDAWEQFEAARSLHRGMSDEQT